MHTANYQFSSADLSMESSSFIEITNIILSYVGQNSSLSEFDILQNRATLMRQFLKDPFSNKVLSILFISYSISFNLLGFGKMSRIEL